MVRSNRIEVDGFEIFEPAISEDKLAPIRSVLADEILRRSRAGVRHAMRHPAVAKFANSPELLRIAQAVLGGDAFPFRATVFHKARTSNWLVVWHQDTALPLGEKRETTGWGPWSVKEGLIYAHAPAHVLERIVALRVHFDDSLPENGPLRVVPGSHTYGLLDEEQIHRLAAQSTSVECLVPNGCVLAMRPLIVHSSSKSISETPRRVLHIEYAASKDIGDGLNLAIA